MRRRIYKPEKILDSGANGMESRYTTICEGAPAPALALGVSAGV